MLYISFFSPGMKHFSKDPQLPYWEMVLKTKTWMLGIIVASRVLSFLGLLSWQSKHKLYMYTNLCVKLSVFVLS